MAKKATPVEVQAERNQATVDYHSEQDAIRIRTAKLRAERLARAAEELKNPTPKVEVPKVKGAAKVKAPPVRKAKSRST
jgi:hypothetical protein